MTILRGDLMKKICVIMTTCGDKKSANSLSKILVHKKLVACVQVIGIKSRFVWKNKVQNEREVLLILKTLRKNRKKIKHIFDSHHPYKLPEFVCFDADSSKKYKKWIKSVVAK